MVRKTTKRKGSKRRKKRKPSNRKRNRLLFYGITVLVLLLTLYIFRFSFYRVARSFYIRMNHISFVTPSGEKNRISKVFDRYDDYVFGADFSHYQGIVNWNRIDTFSCGKPVSFVIVRATMGHDGKDMYFSYNWKKLKEKNIIRGAYHYYRPNENSLKQANNFISRVKLKEGDLPPILDIEQVPTVQSVKNLRIGLKRWLDAVEKHYKVKPILYTGDHYFKTYLSKRDFKDYTLWIANYSESRHPRTGKWKMWQFTEKGNLNGVEGFVDFNVFRGSVDELKEILYQGVSTVKK